MLTITEYQIKFDPTLKGWISFRVVKEGVKPFRLVEKVPLTQVKKHPHLAARALTRVLRLANALH